MNRKLFLLALILGLGLAGLVFVIQGRANTPLTPGNPVMDPPGNAIDILADSPVSITYDEAIDPDTVSTDTFAVHAMFSGVQLGSFSVNGGAIVVDPPQPFKPGELVQVSATTATLNITGTGPLTPTVWQFVVETEAGTGFFIEGGQDLGVSDSLSAALGDLDGDGDLDIYAATVQADLVWINNGQGIFSDSGQHNINPKYTISVALGDLNNDGDLDVFLVNKSETEVCKVLENDGQATLGEIAQTLTLCDQTITNVALGDVDGDGDLDAVLSADGPNHILWNDGSAIFTDSGQSLGTEESTDVALGDVDLDGDLDALFANSEQTGAFSRLYLNDGQGNYSDSGQDLAFAATNGVALADLDGDGDLDAYFATASRTGQPLAPDLVWFNDGQGIFGDSGQSLGTASDKRVVLGDLDSDGDLDAMLANLGEASEVWLNDGQGLFSPGRQDVGSTISHSAPLGDLDGDGDLDAFLTHLGVADEVWFNLNKFYFSNLPLVSR